MTACIGNPEHRDHPASLEGALLQCAREPIHRIGSIQDGGILLAFDAVDWRLRGISANCAALLAMPPDAALGLSIDALLGVESAGKLREMVARQQMPGASIGSLALDRVGVDDCCGGRGHGDIPSRGCPRLTTRHLMRGLCAGKSA